MTPEERNAVLDDAIAAVKKTALWRRRYRGKDDLQYQVEYREAFSAMDDENSDCVDAIRELKTKEGT